MRMWRFCRRYLATLVVAFLITGQASVWAAESRSGSALTATSLISLQEARVIIDAAVAHAREIKLSMAVVVVDQSGNMISADRMEDASFHNEKLAKGKAFASVILRQRTDAAASLAKSSPDRYFGIINMYPGEVYLVGGGIPVTVENRIIGAVGVAGLRGGEDEKAAEAGIAAWRKFREGIKK
jgi:uncharacterized protein GlcG (DUF336 family)